VVTSQKEQKELEELKRKITEYIIAMRIELERKRLVSAVSIYIIIPCYARGLLTTPG
jgi:hypothetical protein